MFYRPTANDLEISRAAPCPRSHLDILDPASHVSRELTGAFVNRRQVALSTSATKIPHYLRLNLIFRACSFVEDVILGLYVERFS